MPRALLALFLAFALLLPFSSASAALTAKQKDAASNVQDEIRAIRLKIDEENKRHTEALEKLKADLATKTAKYERIDPKATTAKKPSKESAEAPEDEKEKEGDDSEQ